jgi:hypothetical protein
VHHARHECSDQASYLLTASVAAPALIKLGLQPLTAHLFIFYFAILSAITPPVCASVYAAATIVGENFWKVAGQVLRITGAVFFIPFMMVYRPELMLAWDGTGHRLPRGDQQGGDRSYPRRLDRLSAGTDGMVRPHLFVRRGRGPILPEHSRGFDRCRSGVGFPGLALEVWTILRDTSHALVQRTRRCERDTD